MNEVGFKVRIAKFESKDINLFRPFTSQHEQKSTPSIHSNNNKVLLYSSMPGVIFLNFVFSYREIESNL
jgi:hypothetical protein